MAYSVDEKFDLLVNRLTFSVTRKIVSKKLGFSAKGNDPFKKKIKEAFVNDSTIESKIDEIWEDAICGGNRLVKVFNDANGAYDKLINHFSNSGLIKHPITDSYPLPVTTDVLNNQCNMDYIFCGFKTIDVAVDRKVKCIVLSNKAYYTLTEELIPSQLSESGQALKESGAKLYCKKRVSTQCFHTIFFDENSRQIFVSIDASVLPNEEAKIQFSMMHQYLRDYVKVLLVDPVNLFGTIHKLYDYQDGGRIFSVSFVTDDGNTDSIKLPSISSGSCVRKDQYHAAGEVATSTLAKFKITKLWNPSDLTVGVELLGNRYMLKSCNSLEQLKTVNCSTLHETIFVIDKVLEHL